MDTFAKLFLSAFIATAAITTNLETSAFAQSIGAEPDGSSDFTEETSSFENAGKSEFEKIKEQHEIAKWYCYNVSSQPFEC